MARKGRRIFRQNDINLLLNNPSEDICLNMMGLFLEPRNETVLTDVLSKEDMLLFPNSQGVVEIQFRKHGDMVEIIWIEQTGQDKNSMSLFLEYLNPFFSLKSYTINSANSSDYKSDIQFFSPRVSHKIQYGTEKLITDPIQFLW